MRGFNPFIVALFFSAAAYTAVTCIEIEVLNCRAGYYLPRDDSKEPGSKWRWSPANDGFWKLHRLNKDGTINESPLSSSESLQMKQDIQAWQNENRLHELVETRGLAQYPICVVMVIACAWYWRKVTRKRDRILVLSSAICSMVGLGFALYRGYQTSLGW